MQQEGSQMSPIYNFGEQQASPMMYYPGPMNQTVGYESNQAYSFFQASYPSQGMPGDYRFEGTQSPKKPLYYPSTKPQISTFSAPSRDFTEGPQSFFYQQDPRAFNTFADPYFGGFPQQQQQQLPPQFTDFPQQQQLPSQPFQLTRSTINNMNTPTYIPGYSYYNLT